MKRQKTFDCVEMKHEIQKKIVEEFGMMNDEEAHRIQMEQISGNPILGQFLNTLKPLTEPNTVAH